jgi:hypothetical protein
LVWLEGILMTQHIRSPIDQQQPAQPVLEETERCLSQERRPGRSGWWIGILALLPIACCGLPLLFAAGLTAGSGAVLGGITGAVLMLLGAAILGTWVMRRHARVTRPADTTTVRSPTRNECR